MAKLTAEQVKFRLRELAERDELGLRTANAAYEHAGDMVRDNLIESPDERRERFERWMWHYAITHPDGEELRKIPPKKLDKAKGKFFARDSGGEYETYAVEDMWACFNAALDFGGGGGE